MNPFFVVLGSVLVLGAGACKPAADAEPGAGPASPPALEAAAGQARGGDAGGYRLDRPSASFSLPGRLKEISALTVLDEAHLGAVQDEDGRLFFLDPETGAITKEVRFAGPGDYEGLELAGERLFVLRADGTLLELEAWRGDRPRVREHDTGLKKGCDAEGLGFDRAGNRLLIACKEKAGKDLKDQRAVYAFDLGSDRLQEEPAYLIDREDLRAKGDDFKPAALAVHPRTGQVYLLSSVHQALVVVEPDGRVSAEWDLPEAGLEQPEGLAFLPDGDLFIASEGVQGAATLQRFRDAGRP